MRLTTVVVMLALAGCAGNQSALPMPPVFSPVEDAPLDVGHPGYVAPQPERSPHKRVLPETPDTRRGPGIWASDIPALPSVPMIAGVALPYPPSAKATAEKDMGRLCAAHMTAAIANADVLARVMALSDDARICTAMRMYEHCTSLTRALVAELSAQKPELAPSQWMALVAAYDRTAKAAVERECIPPKRSAEEDAILGMVLPAYDRIIRATGL